MNKNIKTDQDTKLKSNTSKVESIFLMILRIGYIIVGIGLCLLALLEQIMSGHPWAGPASNASMFGFLAGGGFLIFWGIYRLVKS